MALSLPSHESNEAMELNSTKKLVLWMTDPVNSDNKENIGYITIKNGNLNFHADNDDYYNLLVRTVEDMWTPQRGIPRFKKNSSGDYENDSKGKVIIDDYVFPGKVSADDFLQVILEYNLILGVIGSRLDNL